MPIGGLAVEQRVLPLRPKDYRSCPQIPRRDLPFRTRLLPPQPAGIGPTDQQDLCHCLGPRLTGSLAQNQSYLVPLQHDGLG